MGDALHQVRGDSENAVQPGVSRAGSCHRGFPFRDARPGCGALRHSSAATGWRPTNTLRRAAGSGKRRLSFRGMGAYTPASYGVSAMGTSNDGLMSPLESVVERARPQHERPGFLGRIATAGAVFLSSLVASYQAKADCPSGSPLPLIPTSTNPINTYPKPMANDLKGGDGDPTLDEWVAVDAGGVLHFYNGNSATPARSVNTGIAGATGVAYTPSGLVISQGMNLWEGTENAGSWQTSRTFTPTGITSDILDVDWALGKYFISTLSNGLRRVEADDSSVPLTGYDPADGWLNLEVMTFLDGTYCPIIQISQGANGFYDIDTSGNAISISKPVNLNQIQNIQGIAYYNGGFAVVVEPGIKHYSPWSFAPDMAPIPQEDCPTPFAGTMGDADGDGDADGLDLHFGIMAILDLPGYRSVGGTTECALDYNADKMVNENDIPLWVDDLLNQPGP